MQRSAEIVGTLRAGLATPGIARNLSTLVEKFTFGSVVDGPTSNLGSNIKLSAKGSAKSVDVSVSAGSGSAKASYVPADMRKVAASPLVLQDVSRISTAHSAFMNYLLTLTHERYSVLASWPDFTKAVRAAGSGGWEGLGVPGAYDRDAAASCAHVGASIVKCWDITVWTFKGSARAGEPKAPSQQYGKDYYYRAHPDDLRKFYSMVDEFHRMWDVVTEFGSLSGLAGQLVPGYRVRRHNTVHPALGPATADGAVVQFLLANAK